MPRANKTARISIRGYYPPRGLYESMEPHEEEEPQEQEVDPPAPVPMPELFQEEPEEPEEVEVVALSDEEEEEVSFLGHVVSNGGIAVDPSKVRDVLN